MTKSLVNVGVSLQKIAISIVSGLLQWLGSVPQMMATTVDGKEVSFLSRDGDAKVEHMRALWLSCQGSLLLLF